MRFFLNLPLSFFYTYLQCEGEAGGGSTGITKKQWKRKTTLKNKLSVFDENTKKIVLQSTNQITY